MNRLYSDASKPKTTAEMFAEVWAVIGQLQTARTAEATSVGANGLRFHSGGSATFEDGGGVFIEEGGTLRVTDANGVTIAYFGGFTDGTFGWNFRYDSDDPLFTRQGVEGQQFWGFWDQNGHLIFTSDGVTGTGLGRPYLNIPMVPSSGTSVGTGGPFWPQFTNSSFQEVMYRITTLWHPRITVGVNTDTTSGTVEWELRINGVTAGSGSGDGSGTFEIPGWGDTILPGHQKSVQLWARNTLGTASRLMVDNCYGTQS